MSTIVFLSHTHIGGPFKVGSHHYAEHFADLGYDVLHISTPVSVLHRLRPMAPDKALAVRAGLVEYVPRMASLTPRRLVPLQLVRGREIPSLIRRHAPSPVYAVLVDQPLMADHRLRGLTDRLIYRPTDMYPSGVAAHRQSELLQYVDGVAATSAPVLSELGRTALPTTVINNGVDFSHFAADTPGGERHGVVYVGAFDHRFDWATMIDLAERFSHVRFELVGPMASRPPLPRNVKADGPVPYANVPSVLQRAAVGILPLNGSMENEGRSPMKLYEYLASGLSVVARETQTIHAQPSVGVFTYQDSETAARALARALDQSAHNEAGKREAAAHDWSRATQHLLQFIRQVGEK